MDVCNEKHKSIEEKFDEHERRLNNHGDRIDKLEQFKSSTEIEIRNLIEQIKSLVTKLVFFILVTLMLVHHILILGKKFFQY